MNHKEQERLEKLQEDGEQKMGAYPLEKLTYLDLVLLLKEDKKIRKLLRRIVVGDEDVEVEVSDDPAFGIDAEVEPERFTPPAPPEWRAPVAPVQPERLRQELAAELGLLNSVRADAELAAVWLSNSGEAEGRQLARLVAITAQWDQVLYLWDRLAGRCKSEQRPATTAECGILDACLSIHNLIWQGREAHLLRAERGETYDHRKHQRGRPSGEKVLAEWLPGLTNAGGQVQKTPLVGT